MRNHASRPHSALLAVSALAAVLALPAASGAQEGWTFSPHASFQYQFNTGINDTAGEFEAWRAGGGFDYGGPMGDNSHLNIALNYQHAKYHFTNRGLGVVAGEVLKWDHVNFVGFMPTMSVDINDEWAVVGGAFWQWSAENGASQNASTGGGLIGARRTFSEDFSLTFGIGVTSELEEDSPLPFPYIGIDWQISDTLRLHSPGSSQFGANYVLSWQVSDAFELDLTAGFHRERFRLDGIGPYDDGVGEYRAVPVGGGFGWKLGDMGQMRILGGAALMGRLLIDDSGGDRVGTSRSFNPSPYAGIEAKLEF